MATFDPIATSTGSGSTQPPLAAATSPTQADEKELRFTIEQMEIIARCELDQIATVASLAIEALASPDASQKVSGLVHSALRMIRCKANETICDLQNYATSVDCLSPSATADAVEEARRLGAGHA